MKAGVPARRRRRRARCSTRCTSTPRRSTGRPRRSTSSSRSSAAGGQAPRRSNVHKRRVRYKVDGCTSEVTDVTADGRPSRTIAIESEDARGGRARPSAAWASSGYLQHELPAGPRRRSWPMRPSDTRSSTWARTRSSSTSRERRPEAWLDAHRRSRRGHPARARACEQAGEISPEALERATRGHPRAWSTRRGARAPRDRRRRHRGPAHRRATRRRS